jgi:hypothetical protein
MPRGTIHWASSNEAASIHITMGIHPVLYSEAIMDALTKLFETDVRFRTTMPMGFAADENGQHWAAAHLTELISMLPDLLSPREIVETSAVRATSASLPALQHHLVDLEQAGNIRAGTLMRRRPGQQCYVRVSGDTVDLLFHNKSVQLPGDLAEELRYLAAVNGDGFTAADIPGDLDEPGRLVLIQTLLREGFLTWG